MRHVDPERVYIASRMGPSARLVADARLSQDSAERWIGVWEAEARSRHLDARTSAWWFRQVRVVTTNSTDVLEKSYPRGRCAYTAVLARAHLTDRWHAAVPSGQGNGEPWIGTVGW